MARDLRIKVFFKNKIVLLSYILRLLEKKFWTNLFRLLKLYLSFFESHLFRFSGTCDSPCVSGVCTAKDKCTCDRGFDGTNCNDTAITGELIV